MPLDEVIKRGSIAGYDGTLAHRYHSMMTAIELIRQRRPKHFVETGCQHTRLLFAHGASTLIFGALAGEINACLHTVDISETNLELCRDLTIKYADYIKYIRDDSISLLANLDFEIGFLYLDSFDFSSDAFAGSREHQLAEIRAAWPKLSPNAVILLDDANPQMWFEQRLFGIDREGKTALSHKFLIEKGVECLLDYPCYQRLYRRC